MSNHYEDLFQLAIRLQAHMPPQGARDIDIFIEGLSNAKEKDQTWLIEAMLKGEAPEIYQFRNIMKAVQHPRFAGESYNLLVREDFPEQKTLRWDVNEWIQWWFGTTDYGPGMSQLRQALGHTLAESPTHDLYQRTRLTFENRVYLHFPKATSHYAPPLPQLRVATTAPWFVTKDNTVDHERIDIVERDEVEKCITDFIDVHLGDHFHPNASVNPVTRDVDQRCRLLYRGTSGRPWDLQEAIVWDEEGRAYYDRPGTLPFKELTPANPLLTRVYNHLYWTQHDLDNQA